MGRPRLRRHRPVEQCRDERKRTETEGECEDGDDFGGGIEVVGKAGEAGAVIQQPGRAPLSTGRALRPASGQDGARVARPVADEVLERIEVLMRRDRSRSQEEEQIESGNAARAETARETREPQRAIPKHCGQIETVPVPSCGNEPSIRAPPKPPWESSDTAHNRTKERPQGINIYPSGQSG